MKENPMSTDPFIVQTVQALEKRVEKLEGGEEKGMTNTVDTPEFQKTLDRYDVGDITKAELITIIDAKIAEAVREAVSEALTRFVDADMENRA